MTPGHYVHGVRRSVSKHIDDGLLEACGDIRPLPVVQRSDSRYRLRHGRLQAGKT
jgi:hypothetical protein